MALKQNGILLNQMPLRLRGFDLGARNQFSRTRLWYFGENPEDKKGGFPVGNLAPSSGFLPLQAGGMNGRNSASLLIAPTGSGAMGVNGTGTASLVIDFASASGALIVSGAGTANFTITTTAIVVAALFGDGSSSLVIAPTATMTAKGWGTTAISFTVGGSLTPYALGNMVGSTVDNSVVTNDTIASAVWSKVIEAGYTSEQILRLLAAHAAGAATGLEGADMRFVGLDGVTTRIDGNYSAGTRTIDALDAE